jgi:hypothetical protein
MSPLSSSASNLPGFRAAYRSSLGWIHGAVLFSYLLLTLVMTWPLALQFTTAIPGDSFDGWQNYWNLWWVKLALVDRLQSPYVTDLLYYPTGVGLYFHTLNPFNGLVTLPVQLSAGLIPAYNAVVLISWVLAGYGTYLLTLWAIGARVHISGGIEGKGRDPSSQTPQGDIQGDNQGDKHAAGFMRRPSVGLMHLAAFVAGLIFTFAPVHMAHLLGHMQVMALQWLPFYLLALLRGMEHARVGKPWLREGLLAGLYLTLAGLCDWYFVLYLFLLTAVVIGWMWLVALLQRERRWRLGLGLVGPAAVGGLLFAIVLAPVLVPMVYEALQHSFMVRPTSDLYILSATLLDFLIPNRLHTLFRPESFSWWGNQIAPVSERTLAVGYGALALALVAVGAMRRQSALWAVAALCFLLLALGPRMQLLDISWDDIPTDAAFSADSLNPAQDFSLYAVVNELVPFMRISRSVSRFSIVVQLCVAVMAGIGLAWLLRHLRARLSQMGAVAVGAVAVVVVLGESWVAPFPMSPPDTPAYYATLAQEAGSGAVLNLPMNYDRPGYLLYQTVHQRPLTVAYISRDDPRTLTERAPLLQHWRHLGPDILADDPVLVGMTVLDDLGVERVVLDRYKMPGGEEREYTEALANALFQGDAPLFADERIRVYEVTPPALPQPYLLLGPLHWGPLVEEDDLRSRTLGDGPADLVLLHALQGAEVVITYQSAVDAVVSSTNGDSWKLSAAPTGSTLSVVLPPGVDRLTFNAPPDQVQILRLEMLLPTN